MSDKRINDRLRRLLSMTVDRGASEAEALAAAEAAARLMAEHNLSYRSVEEIEAEDFREDERPWFRGSKGQFRAAPIPPVRHCLGAIERLCGVEHSYNTYHGTLMFFGTPSDIEVAHYLTVIISRAMDREWRAYSARLPSGQAGKQRASFLLAMGVRISRRLYAMAAAEEARSQSGGPGAGALVVVKNALVKSKFEALHPNIRTTAPNLTARSIDGVKAGFAAGDRVQINKGINEAHGALALVDRSRDPGA